MILTDNDIKVFVENGRKTGVDAVGQTAIYNGDDDCVTNIGYDLRASGFIVDNKAESEYELKPGETVFMMSVERIAFDNFTCGQIHTKNSRIRMGITSEAPLYQPGHTTNIFVRLTNISDKTIELKSGAKYVMLTFEQLDRAPENPYSGTFQNEESFKNLAGYNMQYSEQMKQFEKKQKNLEALERSIYGNVVMILTIFIAIFSIINVNVSLAASGSDKMLFLMMNASVLGAVSLLAVLMDEIIHRDMNGKRSHWLWIVPCFFIAIVLLICFFVK